MTGGQDELVFDGHSLVLNENGELVAKGKRFEEDDIIFDITIDESAGRICTSKTFGGMKSEDVAVAANLKQNNKAKLPDRGSFVPQLNPDMSSAGNEDTYKALVLGTRDYVQKNGFNTVCIGMSGGIDSSLVAAVAVDALGRDNVVGIFMPSPYTSEESRLDAYELAGNLGMKILEIPISSIFNSYLHTLKPEFEKLPSGIAEENIQARIRGNILMGFSNKFGWLILTTGNKSEMSVGYATLYGDMAGGFAPIKDVPKMLVYRLCEWRNGRPPSPTFPDRVLTKEPTAELKPDQKDTDSLPPYEVLDPILKAYIEDFKGYEEIIALGFNRECVRKVIMMVDRSEYKRRQGPPGIKITPMAFGRDRRFPITNKYRSC
jgi:NAD+ synthase (glutamine-hydrolysing)